MGSSMGSSVPCRALQAAGCMRSAPHLRPAGCVALLQMGRADADPNAAAERAVKMASILGFNVVSLSPSSDSQALVGGCSRGGHSCLPAGLSAKLGCTFVLPHTCQHSLPLSPRPHCRSAVTAVHS